MNGTELKGKIGRIKMTGLEALENLLKQELIRPNKYRKTIGDIASVGQVAIIQDALERLDFIDNTKPSEALKDLKELHELAYDIDVWKIEDITQSLHIKQALIKAQEQDKVLEIIKEKCLHNDNLNWVAVCINYDMYKVKMNEKHNTKVVKIDWNDRKLLDYLKLLTKEEFNALKRWLENE